MCFGSNFKIFCLLFGFSNALVLNHVKKNPEVNTTSGSIEGKSFSESHAFYSIPYGEAPVGELRFQPPLAVSHRGKIDCSIPNYRKCYGFPITCYSEEECEIYSEDCLVLNVHVPSTVDLPHPNHHKKLLPVMVWIHGGAFSDEAGTERMYDGQTLSNATNTIVVSINYRLNALGFLAFEEGQSRFDGNQGIKDQQLALKWIHDNIRNFGGDKNKVTLFGESAGAQYIVFHLMSNISKPLFKRAIIQSNPGALHYPTRTEAMLITNALLSTLNCTGSRRKCLIEYTGIKTPTENLHSRGIPCHRDTVLQIENFFSRRSTAAAFGIKNRNLHSGVFTKSPGFFCYATEETSPEILMQSHLSVVRAQTNNVDSEVPYRPLLDGVEFRVQPFEYFSKMEGQIDKEIVLGTNSDEMALIKLTLAGQRMTREMFLNESINYIGEKFGLKAAEKYLKFAGNVKANNNYASLLSQQLADYIYTCPTRALARLLSSKSFKNSLSSNVYLYVFDYNVDASNCEQVYGGIVGGLLCNYATHSAELPYLFDSGKHTGLRLTPSGERLSRMVRHFWGHFAHYGKPNKHLRIWSPYTEFVQNGTILPWTNIRLRPPRSFSEAGYRDELCDFWDSSGLYVNLTSPTPSYLLVQSPTSGCHRLKLNFALISLMAVFKLVVYQFFNIEH